MTDLKAPWAKHESYEFYASVFDTDGDWVATVSHHALPTVLAAPELAARCERLLEAMLAVETCLSVPSCTHLQVGNALGIAHAAIAEAEESR